MFSARLLLKYIFIIFFSAFLYFFLPTLSPVHAQYHRYFTGHVEDQALNKYNLYGHACSPTYNGVSVTYGPDIVSWVWNPCSVGGPTFTGDFINSGPLSNTETITFALPIGFSCTTTTWAIYRGGVAISNGTGCDVILQKPTGSYNTYIVVQMGLAPTPTPLPVCVPPPQPTGLTQTCLGANQINLSWNPNGFAHALRIDNKADPWTATSCNNSTGPGDHCINNLPPGTNSYTFQADPNQNYSFWIHSLDACGSFSTAAAIPAPNTFIRCNFNCSITNGPSTLYVGTGSNFTTSYFSTAAPANAELVYLRGGSTTLISYSNIPANTDTSITNAFTPQVSDIGVGSICCRTINNPNAQCTAAPYNPATPPTRYNCVGPNVCRTVTVVAPDEWYKLSNASFHKRGLFDFTLPSTVETFDDIDDTTEAYPSIGNAGVVTTDTASITVASPHGTASVNAWQRVQFTDDDNYLQNLNKFVDYAKDRKEFVTITNVNQMQSNKINIVAGNTLIGPFNQYNDNVTNAVLLVQGNLDITPETIGVQTLNPFHHPVAFIATGRINVHSEYRELNGIFIANRFDLAYNITPPSKSTTELKIKGNIISLFELDDYAIKRKRTNPYQPSMFVVFDPWMYYELLPHLTTITQEGRQVE